jgi:hypothetical protein
MTVLMQKAAFIVRGHFAMSGALTRVNFGRDCIV